MLLVWLCTAQGVLAQPLQRKTEQQNTEEFTLTYTFLSDSLKGFFMVAEAFTGKTKLLKTKCDLPYRFENGRLQISGEKIPAGLQLVFTFKMLEKNVAISGSFSSENFGGQKYQLGFNTIRLEKPEPLLTADQQHLATASHRENTGEMYPKIKTSSSGASGSQQLNEIANNQTVKRSNDQTVKQSKAKLYPNQETSPSTQPPLSINHPQSTINNQPDTVFAVSFRVQLAASTTPMDRSKLRQLSGLDLPVYEDRIDNYFKYTIGNETSIKAAQDLLNRVAKNNFKKPFIVAYRDKNRITVQQAVDEINRINAEAVYQK